MKKLLHLVAVALYGCSADPGYEPRHEPHESQPYVDSEARARTTPSPAVPQKTGLAMQACADRYALRLPKTSDSYALLYDLEVTGNGTTAKVKDSMIPGSELETCLTGVLERMAVPDEVARGPRVSPQSRSMVGVVQAAAAPIALLPIVLAAGGVTILVGVSIYVATEVVDAVGKRRRPTKNRCLDAAAAGGAMWRAFCRDVPDPIVRAGCWGLAERRSEQEKRNWCNEHLGFW